MALPFTETWTGTNGNAWPAQWTTTSGTTGFINDIQSNAGRQKVGSQGGYLDYTYAISDLGGSDFELRIDATTTSNEFYIGISFRTDGTFNTSLYTNNGWTLETAQGDTELYHTESSVRTSMGFVVGSYDATTVHYRILALGTRIKVRAWTGATEPGTWTHEADDTLHTTRTGFGLSIFGGSAVSTTNTVTWDDLTATTPPFPVFHAAGTAQESVTTATVPWPTHVANDIGLLLIESTGGQPATLSTAAGFAAVTGSPSATGTTTNGTQITAFWCRATSSSMSSPVVADPGDHVYAVILTFLNCITTGNPWNATAAAVKASASTAMSMPAVTTTVANSLIVNAASRDNDLAAAAGSAPVNSSLAALGERFDAGTALGNGGGLMVWTGRLAAAGSSGTTTATVTSSINAYLTIALTPVPVPSTANVGTASFTLVATSLSRGSGLPSASLALTAYNLSKAATTSTANLGTALLAVAANNLSSIRNLNSASLTLNANLFASSLTLGKADIGFTGLSLDLISLGAEPIGQTRTLPSASLILTANDIKSDGNRATGLASFGIAANGLTFGGQVLPAAAVALAANILSGTRTFNVATLALTAYGLTVAAVTSTASLGAASLTLNANRVTFNDALAVIAASLGISANAIGLIDSPVESSATLGLSASGLSGTGTRNAGTASLDLSATGLSAGFQLANASLSVLANNLSLLGSFNLGTATVAFSASNLSNQTTGQATLGTGNVSVNAGDLSVALSAGLSASLAMSATNLARAAVVGTASLSTSALGMTQLRSTALGLALLFATAYNMSQSAPGSAALGSGTLLLSANPMTRFALLSAGLATVALDANAIQPKVNASGAVGSMSTAAQPMSSTRAVAKGILDLTAYGFGTYRPSALGTAALTITAYRLSAQTGKSKGKISVRNGYVQFKTGGTGLTGPKVANPISSFKTVGG